MRKTLQVKEIFIGERIREDMGDIEDLAKSIEKYGLLHPIVIDENNNLIAGHRRLQAVTSLGWEEVDVKYKTHLSDKEKRLLELEENTKRKDLTEYEKSKNIVELVEITKSIIEEEKKNDFYSPSEQKQKLEKGRPRVVASQRVVSERIGISTGSITEAKKHVEAVEKHPELEALPKKEAIKTAKDSEKVDQYKAAIKEFPELEGLKMPVSATIKAAENLRQIPKDVQQAKLKQAKEVAEQGAKNQTRIDNEYKEMKKIESLISNALHMSSCYSDVRFEIWLQYHSRREDLIDALNNVQTGIDELSALKSSLEECVRGPRKVVGINEARSRY